MVKVSDVMTRGVCALSPSDNLQTAAQAMDDLNIGAIPICEDDRVIGMVTDRDITVRGVAQGLAPDTTPLSEVMSQEVEICYDDDSLEDATQKMQDIQIRRLAVLDGNDQLVGIISLGDVATKGDADQASAALCEISEPSEPDRSGSPVGTRSFG
jgi:CBS domain-containing protein